MVIERQAICDSKEDSIEQTILLRRFREYAAEERRQEIHLL